ncbi:uncharacterized protein LOC143530228 [Bidens hawaiensis]|uniref:uncharacterized protein LOC143530228 n=1 Tax=Bidens hawaiensis TaxID=980011 RepID=UPI00404A7CC5
MDKKDLRRVLPHIEHENQLCESCLMGKQTRRSFLAKSSFRASQPLELSHGDLCGPITPPAISVYAKVDSVHLKKLDDRSRRLVYLKSEKNSKAYRLFDQNTRKLVVSWYVLFDEKKGQNWVKKIEKNDYEPDLFSIVWEGAVDNGTGQIEPTIGETVEATRSKNNGSKVHSGENEAQKGLRRSNQVPVLPTILQEDYVLHVDSDYEQLLLTASGEPSSYFEAKSNQEWVHAIITEINLLNTYETWKLVELPKGSNISG